MTRQIFTRPFTQQESISQEAIDAATEVLKTGRLHRYNTIEDELSQVSLLEKEYANYQGSRYCSGLCVLWLCAQYYTESGRLGVR